MKNEPFKTYFTGNSIWRSHLNPVNKLLLQGDFSLLLTWLTLDRHTATITEK